MKKSLLGNFLKNILPILLVVFLIRYCRFSCNFPVDFVRLTKDQERKIDSLLIKGGYVCNERTVGTPCEDESGQQLPSEVLDNCFEISLKGCDANRVISIEFSEMSKAIADIAYESEEFKKDVKFLLVQLVQTDGIKNTVFCHYFEFDSTANEAKEIDNNLKK